MPGSSTWKKKLFTATIGRWAKRENQELLEAIEMVNVLKVFDGTATLLFTGRLGGHPRR